MAKKNGGKFPPFCYYFLVDLRLFVIKTPTSQGI